MPRETLPIDAVLPHLIATLRESGAVVLRDRYPKHSWPEDPLTAEATRGVRRRAE